MTHHTLTVYVQPGNYSCRVSNSNGMDEFFFSYPLGNNIASASEILRNLTLYRTQKSTVIVSVLSEITKYDQSFSIYQLGKGSTTLTWYLGCFRDWSQDWSWNWSWN